jgi:aldose 1-epimerase
LGHQGGAHAEIVPEWGNNCISFRVPEPILEPVPFGEILSRPTSYGIPILFPFPNRIRDGRFGFRGEHFTVHPDRHGFVRNKRWQVQATGADVAKGAWITSRIEADWYPEDILAQFPFPFRLEVTHCLKEGQLEITAVATNTGSSEMPCGFGLHPYFRRPEHGTLQVPAGKRWELVNQLPTGDRLDADGAYDLRYPRDVLTLNLDDIFTDLIAGADGLVRCVLDDRTRGIRTTVEFDRGTFPNVVIYTPPVPRQAICIEPYTCPTDAFNLHGRGVDAHLVLLAPEASILFEVRMSAQRSM